MMMQMMKTILLLSLLLTIVSSQRPSSHRLDVYIAGFFPYGDGVENSDTGRGVMPSVKLALDHVNEHSSILKNYRLHMWWNDTECNAAVGVKSFFDMMHSGPHKLMLFGAACTHVTDPIAKASKHWHLTQLSYADTHPMFTKDAFPNFFRVVPSENAFNAPRLSLLKEFNWTRVGTIYQNQPRYSLPHNHMVADLDAMGLEVAETQSFVQDVSESLNKLREKDVRIILGNFNEYWARKVFCEAFRLEMYGRAYQWLIMGTYTHEWWNVSDTDCTVEELKIALESIITTDLLPLSTSGDITISGITADEYMAEYNSRRGNEYSRFHGYTYDGIWAVAMAIQYVSQRKDQFLNNFQYRVKEWENIFLEALKNTSFEGVTGPVRFYNNERKANFLLKQFQNGSEVKVGEYSSLHQRLDLTLGEPLKWVGKSPPKDRTLRIIEHSQVNITIYVILASCSALGIVISSIFLGVNIKYRNQRYIKMSSPHLNNLIIIGCMLTYLSVIFLGLDSGLSSVAAFPYICTARAWLLMAGFSLAFGAMFSKTWRVHSIFTDLKLNKKVIKDYQLFMVVGVLLAADLAIMTTWQIADPFYRDTKQIEPYSHPTMEDVLIVRENEYCQSERMTIFIGIIYAYKGLLLIFGAFLAWETRNVSIPALNDSKHVGLSVYNVVIMCIMGAAIALVLSDRKDAVFILISVFIIFCTTGTLCLVFVPKIVELKRNPSGAVDKRVRATLRPMSKNRRDSSVCELEQRLRDVKSTNCRFRKALMEREAELQQLIRKLGPDARNWLDGGTSEIEQVKEPARLIVPTVVKKDPPSLTATDLTSINSEKSNHDEQRKKVATINNETVHINNSVSINKLIAAAILPADIKMGNAEVQTTQSRINEKPIIEPKIKSTNNSRKNSTDASTMVSKWSPNDSSDLTSSNLTKFNTHMNTTSLAHSNSELNTCCQHVKGGMKAANANDPRRVSVQIGTSMKNNFVVSQSDLWDTHTFSHAKHHSRQSPRNYASSNSSQNTNVSTSSRCPDHGYNVHTDYEYDTNYKANNASLSSSPGPIQRSVSEKNRSKHRHKQKQIQTVCQSETDSERERDNPLICSTIQSSNSPSMSHHQLQQQQQQQLLLQQQQQNRKMKLHHHSTPNVVDNINCSNSNIKLKHSQQQSEKYHKHRKTKKECSSNIYNASSETELIDDNDTAILPIFRKLLNDKESRYHRSPRSMVGASCPNISIKCDIVEYL